MSLAKPWSSTAFRLALTYGVLLVLTMSIVLSVFYVQTVGVLRMRTDRQAENHMRRLVEHRDKYGEPALEAEIQQTLLDGVNTDTEILDRKSTRLNSSHLVISYAVFCLK